MVDLTACQSLDSTLAKVAAQNGELRALIHVDAVRARAQATEIDASTAERGVLVGTTFVVKDLIDVAGLPTAGGSRLFGNGLAVRDAACVARLKAACAVVLGKSNMHELAVGGAVNPWFGQVINPLSRSHGAGGTSSGSAAAVAAGFCSFALGTDSGGSNRSVAAACGLYGYKPTKGLIASVGVRPTAPTLDTLGVIAPSAEMISRCLRVLTDAAPAQDRPLEGMIFARMINLVTRPMDQVVTDAMDHVFAAITRSGGKVTTLRVQAPAELAQAGVAILRHEFAEIHGPMIDRSPEKVGPAVHAFLAASRGISPGQYGDALALRAEHQALWAANLAQVDGFITPTAPGLAPDLEAEMTRVGTSRVAYGAAGAEYRMWANTIGIPAVAIPVQRARGLAASVQLAGAMNSDAHLVDLAAKLGRALS